MDLRLELSAHADFAQINGPETKVQGRGITLEAEIIFVRRDEQGIGNG